MHGSRLCVVVGLAAAAASTVALGSDPAGAQVSHLHTNYELGVESEGQAWQIRTVHRSPGPIVQRLGPYEVTASTSPGQPGLYTLTLTVERVAEHQSGLPLMSESTYVGAYGSPLSFTVEGAQFVLSGAMTVVAEVKAPLLDGAP